MSEEYTAYNLDQAREYFLDYQVDPVTCVKAEERQVCFTFEEATEFFNGPTEPGSPETPPE